VAYSEEVRKTAKVNGDLGMAKLGQLLVARGWINVQQLTRALQNQNAVGGRLGTCLLEMDVLGEDLLSRSLAEQLGVPAATIEELRGIPDEVLRLIPEKLARRCRAIPFRVAGGRLDVAMQDPRNLSCQDEIAFACGRRVKVHVGHEARIFEALDKYYGEECPSRYGLLLDRLNRMRYLWEKDQPKVPEATREQTLPALPLAELFAGEPAMAPMAPPPLPEPYLPPSPRPRASGIRARPPAPAPPPASMPPPPAPPPHSALPPLAEFDLRPAPRRPRAAAPPSAEPPPAQPAPPRPLRPIPPGGILPADVQPLAPEQRRAEPARAAAAGAAFAGAPLRSSAPVAPPAGTPVVPTAAPAAFAGAPGPAAGIDLDSTRDVSPAVAPPAGPPPPARETVALTPDERAALGVAPEEAAPAAAAAAPPAAPSAVAMPEAPALAEAEPPAAVSTGSTGGPTSEPKIAAAAGRDNFAAAEAALAATRDREEVGRILLAFLGREYRRVALFGVTRDHVSGWMAAGDGIDQPGFARFAVGFDQPSVFLNLREGSGMHLGPLPPMAAHRELALLWGGGLPRDSVVLPVRLQQRLVAVVYADGGSHGLGGLDLERMRRLTAAAGAAFERCIRARRDGGT
jgi:hypothetical protein